MHRNARCVTSVVSGRSVPGAIGLIVPKFYIFTRKHNQKRSSPSRFSMHLPVLDGRYQPALKIDMTEERGCAAVEGEHAVNQRKMAWIRASQTGPMAILRFPCPVQARWPGGAALHSRGLLRPCKRSHEQPG